MFGNVYRIFKPVAEEKKNIVHCVKCVITKMFCIISVFIVFIAYVEVPTAYKKKMTINAA